MDVVTDKQSKAVQAQLLTKFIRSKVQVVEKTTIKSRDFFSLSLNFLSK